MSHGINKFGEKGNFDTSGDELNMQGRKIVGLPTHMPALTSDGDAVSRKILLDVMERLHNIFGHQTASTNVRSRQAAHRKHQHVGGRSRGGDNDVDVTTRRRWTTHENTPARRPLKDGDGVAQRRLRSRIDRSLDGDVDVVTRCRRTRLTANTRTSTISHLTATSTY